MTEVTLDFRGRQIQRVLDEQRTMRDELTVFGGRIDALAAIGKQSIDETRHVGRQVQQPHDRMRRVEALEGGAHV